MSDRPGTADLNIVHEGAGSNAVVPFTPPNRTSGRVESISLSTVDAFCVERALERVTLLKIDAECHELAVMRGAAGMLKARAVELVRFNWRWIEARCFLPDAFELLGEYGYRLGKITPRGAETYEAWHPELESFREANYLAFLPEWSGKLPTIEW